MNYFKCRQFFIVNLNISLRVLGFNIYIKLVPQGVALFYSPIIINSLNNVFFGLRPSLDKILILFLIVFNLYEIFLLIILIYFNIFCTHPLQIYNFLQKAINIYNTLFRISSIC